MNLFHQRTVTLNQDKDCLKPVTYVVQKENLKTCGYFKSQMQKAFIVCPDCHLKKTLQNQTKEKQQQKNHITPPNPHTPVN